MCLFSGEVSITRAAVGAVVNTENWLTIFYSFSGRVHMLQALACSVAFWNLSRVLIHPTAKTSMLCWVGLCSDCHIYWSMFFSIDF